MVLSKYSLGLVLDLIEDRINQLDPLTPQDERDLEALVRCREEMKVTARIGAKSDEDFHPEFDRSGLQGAGRRESAAASLSLDVI